MSNIEIAMPLFDGGLVQYHKKGESCQKAVKAIAGGDLTVQPRCLTLIVHTQSGKMVDVVIPFDGRAVAQVFLDGILV